MAMEERSSERWSTSLAAMIRGGKMCNERRTRRRRRRF